MHFLKYCVNTTLICLNKKGFIMKKCKWGCYNDIDCARQYIHYDKNKNDKNKNDFYVQCPVCEKWVKCVDAWYDKKDGKQKCYWNVCVITNNE